MTSRVTSTAQAYAALGLEPGDGLDAARSAFRALVKTLHPDVTPPTPDTLSRLAEIVGAMDHIKAHAPVCLDIEISRTEAATGVTRTLRQGGRPVLVRVPAGTQHGDRITAVGEPGTVVTVRIAATDDSGAADIPSLIDRDDLDAFIHEYSRPSAHARLARWIRKAQSAA